MGLINDITAELATIGANFISFNAHVGNDGMSRLSFLFVLSDLNLALKITENLAKIDSVSSVYRAASGHEKHKKSKK